ncbi:MAG: transposase [Acidobacteriota bacterium]
MGRLPRFIPKNKDGVLVEVTSRVIGARALLVPSPGPRRFNEVVVGILGRALEVSPLELCSTVWTSNHVHSLAVVHDQQQLSRFMHHLGCNVSKEVGTRLRGWRGTFWERRYDCIVISDEPEAQWRRLKYHLSHGVKEGLVESPLQWPGVHAARALVHGEPLEGAWFNRSKEWAAKNRGLAVGRYDFATRYLVGFAQLPAFRHLEPEEYRSKIAELIREIEQEGEAARDGNPVAGVEKILSQNPYEPPTRQTKRSAKPRFHAISKPARLDFEVELQAFLAEYWAASEALRSGNLEAAGWFPDGCYPPAQAFAGVAPQRRPPLPSTRQLEVFDSGEIERGAVPIVELTPAVLIARLLPRARGHPP